MRPFPDDVGEGGFEAHPYNKNGILFPVPVIFLFALIFFFLLQPWGAFLDPDSFYHAKLADIILHGTSIPGVQGLHVAHLFFLQNFPWLDLTLLNTHFVDQHLFYHLALTPFVALFGMFHGLQIATVIFAATFITIFYAILRRLSIQHPLIWTTLAVFSMPLSFRLSLGKATPFALTAFVLGIYAMTRVIVRGEGGMNPAPTKTRSPVVCCVLRVTYPIAFLAGLLFSLSHGGWIILLVAQFLYLVGTWIFDRYVVGRSEGGFETRPYKIIGLTVAGIATGLLIHPNRANLLPFLYTQIIQVAIGAHPSTQLGLEWASVSVGSLIGNLGPLVMASFIVLLGLILAARRPLDLPRARTIIGLGLVLAALVAFTLKSSRMIEYLIPIFSLWLGSLWTLVDPTRFKQELLKRFPTRPYLLRVACCVFALVIANDLRGTYRAFRVNSRHFDRLAPVAEVLNREASPGERIFHDRWDSFPELFALAPRFRYVSGVDPTFLIAANPTLGATYERVTSDLKAPIPPELQTRWSILERSHDCRGSNAQSKLKDGRVLVCETVK